MNQSFKKVLLIYKKSAYSIYFMERKLRLASGKKINLQKELKRFKKAHDEHHQTLERIENILCAYGILYKKQCRGGTINYSRYDFIISVGGDGTFLEACQKIKDQVIVGVNSSPSFSVGKLCSANVKNFEKIIQRIVKGKFTISLWPRIRLALEGHIRPVDCVNDVLICHSDPAAMSRYYLEIGKIKEEQRSSGLWVATPAGSSGAIKSAGGKQLKFYEKKIQYMPRELYYGFRKHYCHTGGVLKAKSAVAITSLMRNGIISIDGTHIKLKFPFNSTLKISLSPNPLRALHIR
jgi:NAD+ kinase